MKAIVNYLKHLPAAVVRMRELDDSVDPDWPEVVLCPDHESAAALEGHLNRLIQADFREYILEEEPGLTADEIQERFVEMRGPVYVTHAVTDVASLDQLAHRIPLSLKALKARAPDVVIAE